MRVFYYNHKTQGQTNEHIITQLYIHKKRAFDARFFIRQAIRAPRIKLYKRIEKSIRISTPSCSI